MPVVDKFIPARLYRRMHELLPLVMVDLVVWKTSPRRFLLVRRSNRPKAGSWWFPGGRVLKNERLKTAALRKLKEEIGLSGEVIRELGTHEWFCREGYFSGINAHTIVFVFFVRVGGRKAIRLDAQSSDWRWYAHVSPRWDPYVRKFLKLAGFR